MSSRNIEEFNYGHGYTVGRSEYPALRQVILEKKICLWLLRDDTIYLFILASGKS